MSDLTPAQVAVVEFLRKEVESPVTRLCTEPGGMGVVVLPIDSAEALLAAIDRLSAVPVPAPEADEKGSNDGHQD